MPGSTLKELFELAKRSRERSHAPYSRCLIGAAIRTSDGRMYGGCNVENSSYGATVCAERTAVVKAVSEGSTRIEEVVVVTDATPPWPPCGICRQVIMDFVESPAQVKIHLADLKGIQKTLTLSELLPTAFDPSYLPEHLKE